ncbi:MAG TPA: hypothetical protein VJ901_19415 [Thermoanaerobaculia bacterium]|nr:hypothetical protein [Thermoanaerobaculia bacterium]
MFLLIAALLVHHHTKFLAADGAISPELVADPAKWLATRDAFIRSHAPADAKLPLVYKLDDDFVTAARTRQSIEVVDDCGDALCGVATDELVEDWELADLRALHALPPRPAKRGEGPGVRGFANIKGATVSVVNRIDKHLIANSSKQVFQHLHDAGYNSISLIPFAATRANDVIPFNRHPAGETDLSMRLGIVRAHNLGMQVMLKPHVWPHGGDPTKFEPPSWETWFASYENYVLHEAQLAERMHVEWLCIGTELSRSESRPEWHQLIRKVRALYHGRITYAANFDAFEKTPFWRELDAIGVDAYFPLASTMDATDAQLLAGAREAVARMQRVAKATGRNVILTELGYPKTPGAWIDPWAEHRERDADPSAQKRSFDAMFAALKSAPNISGYFVWKYESDPNFVDEKGYLPK